MAVDNSAWKYESIADDSRYVSPTYRILSLFSFAALVNQQASSKNCIIVRIRISPFQQQQLLGTFQPSMD
jgi:hypothetical protein